MAVPTSTSRRLHPFFPQHPYYGWVLATALGVTTIVSYGTTQYLFGVLVVPISDDFGWDRATISGAFSLGLIVSGMLGVPIGRLVDRRGARVLMTIGSALGGGSLIALSTIQRPWQLYALWSGGLGLAMALTFYPVTFTVVTQWFHRRRGSAMALVTSLGGLASPIFIPLAGWLVPHLGWRGTVVALGVLQLVVCLPLHATLVRRHPEDLGLLPDGDPDPEELSQGRGARLQGHTLLLALRRPAFWTLTFSASLVMMAGSVLFAHQVAYLIGLGYDAVLAASLAGAVGLASLPGRLILNVLSDRIGSQWLLSLCIAVQAVGVVALVSANSAVWIAVYIVLFGGAFGAISPLRASVLAEQFGRRAYGSIIAVQGVPVAIFAGVGPFVAGSLYDMLGNYRLALWLTVVAFALACAGVAVTPRPTEVALS